jgi:hypothetical protein
MKLNLASTTKANHPWFKGISQRRNLIGEMNLVRTNHRVETHICLRVNTAPNFCQVSCQQPQSRNRYHLIKAANTSNSTSSKMTLAELYSNPPPPTISILDRVCGSKCDHAKKQAVIKVGSKHRSTFRITKWLQVTPTIIKRVRGVHSTLQIDKNNK